MAKVNRGKDFEQEVRDAFERVPQTSVDRLIDPQNGYAGVRNICDFIIYHYPIEFYIECKSCYGNTLSIHTNNPKNRYGNITNNQWEGLLEKSETDGVVAGYIIWFIDNDITLFVPAKVMSKHKELGNKSFNVKKEWPDGCFEISGKKKRVLFEYDMSYFIENFGGKLDGTN